MKDVALVTGGAGTIGRAICERLGADGLEVVVADLQTGVDVTDEVSVREVFDRATGLGRLRAVVLAVGVVARGSVTDMTLGDWRHVIETNLTSAFICSREAARRMSGPGAVVFISSQAGRKGAAGWSAYSASKFGVIGLMESLAQELAAVNVRCNAVCPGSVATPMLESSSDDLERQRAAIPLGRFAEPPEIASLVSYLCSDDASYVTGASVVADGGELS
jgi:3-oxoacyl-[acyl-carrier protein] reductase